MYGVGVVEFLNPEHFAAAISSGSGIDRFASDQGGLVVLTGVPRHPLDIPPMLPVVVALGVHADEDGPAGSVDVVATGTDLDRLIELVERRPRAATAFAAVLRGSEDRAVEDGLQLESAVYGVLQAGPEFAEWRAERPPRQRTFLNDRVVRIEHRGLSTRVLLDRPEVRNAFNGAMRDELAAVLHLVLDDPERRLELSGLGPVFCSGGDLDEFGTRSDPASAHLVRLSRNVGWLIAQVADRVTVTMHGACAGSGVELPAFAGRVVASADTSFALPEVALGLIPGAGGTVSLPRRIGRQRTAWLGLTGRRVDATTALRWGLVDEITGAR